MKSNKQFAIIVLWTCIALIIGIFLFFRRNASTGPRPVASRSVSGVVQRSPNVQPAAHESEPKQTDKFVLVTLNDTLISTETLELIPENVSVFRKVSALASQRTGGLVVLFSLPDESVKPDAADVPEDLRSLIHSRLEEAGLFSYGLKPHRVVFTQSIEGRISVGRQIEACMFIDPDSHVVSELSGKVPGVSYADTKSFKRVVLEHKLFFQNSANS
jgi:hypothetical protein